MRLIDKVDRRLRAARWLAMLFVAVLCVGCADRPVTPMEVELSIRHAVPLGSGHLRVSEVLDSLDIEHSPYDDGARRILAIKRRTQKGLFVRADVQIAFGFDLSGSLISIQATQVFTGP